MLPLLSILTLTVTRGPSSPVIALNLSVSRVRQQVSHDFHSWSVFVLTLTSIREVTWFGIAKWKLNLM